HLAFGWSTLLETAAAAGRWRLARYAARRAIEADPAAPARWGNAAEVALHAGRTADATSWANRVATEAPDSRAFLEAKAMLSFVRGDFEEPLALVREDLASKRLSCCRQVLVAACCIELRDDHGARKALEQAELVRPTCGCFRRQRVERLLASV